MGTRKTRSGRESATLTGMQCHIHWILHGGGLTLVCWTTRKMKLEGGGHVMIGIYHCFMQQNVHLMLSTFCRCMGITCNIWGRAQDPTQLTHTLRGGGKHATGYRALRLQSLLSDDYAGTLGDYEIIIFLPRKAAFSCLSIITRISELQCLAFLLCRRRRLVMRIWMCTVLYATSESQNSWPH